MIMQFNIGVQLSGGVNGTARRENINQTGFSSGTSV
jgi:hypothetical protein